MSDLKLSDVMGAITQLTSRMAVIETGTKNRAEAIKPIPETDNPCAPVMIDSTANGLTIRVPEITAEHGHLSSSGKAIIRVSKPISINVRGMTLGGSITIYETLKNISERTSDSKPR